MLLLTYLWSWKGVSGHYTKANSNQMLRIMGSVYSFDALPLGSVKSSWCRSKFYNRKEMLAGPIPRPPYAFELNMCKQLLLFTPEAGYLSEVD